MRQILNRPAPSSNVDSPWLVVSDQSNQEKRFALNPDQIADIGRSATSRIMVDDDRCSRGHCEIFQGAAGWTLRDRESRNGTYLNGNKVTHDKSLADGDIIRIGTSFLLFTHDAEASLIRPGGNEPETSLDMPAYDENAAQPVIIHRQKQSSYRSDGDEDPTVREDSGVELSRLYKMALKMGDATSISQLADIVLNALVGITGADIGAVLTTPMPQSEANRRVISTDDLEITSYRSLEGHGYQRVSSSLSEQVFSSGEAILAQDILQQDGLSARDSLDQLQARSLIVVPVQRNEDLFGLIHLYSTNPENPLDADALDYALAVADQFGIAMKSLRQKEELEQGLHIAQTENQQLREQLEIDSELVGNSLAMQTLREAIGKIAPSDAVALVRGESGSGKELVARAIHYNSLRTEKPFVCMNCAALSESLLESELFGHEKGSFTGATGLKHGKFEQAHEGTLFLDEVGEMSPAIQAKFLRVMEGHPFERVGGSESVSVDVRLVAATNRDLEEAVREGTFRKDLYFRLQVLEIVVPPLRRRMEDVPLLAQFFAERFARKSGRPVLGFTRHAIDKLTSYDWPGNVRELQNTIERAVVLSSGQSVDVNQIRLSQLESNGLKSSPPVPQSSDEHSYQERSMEELEKEHILKTLESTSGNKSKAASILGIERSTLDRKLKKYGLKIVKE